MTDPTPEPSPDAEGQNAHHTPEPQLGNVPPAPDPEEILKAISGINLETIDADIESAFGARMAQLDEMLAGLDSLVNKIEQDIQNLDQPKPDGPQ
ncbi:hypothetical protein [Nocardia sp. NRRL S-836]|uniref:hypothetical protein n=1 Tax=Nocardia sp. NRRL S-836 TaxID=1519492 RepID=UPI0006AE68C7|nr:hypothetical protein [Nocardia sp. NRRL S-836]KOV75448.1 hypothetical protein ADL03_44010 [Nocardia sp. NRRL S-836]